MATPPQTAPSQNSIETSLGSLQHPPEAAASKPPASSPPASPPPASPPPAPPKSPPPASPPPAPPTSPPPSPPASPPPASPTSPPPPAPTKPPKESPPPSHHTPPPKESPPPHTPLSPPPPPPPSTPNPNPTASSSPPAPIFSPPPPAAVSHSPPSGSLTQPPPSHSSPANKPSGSSGGSRHSPSPSDSTNVAIISGIVVGGVVILAILITCLILSRSRRNKKQPYYMSPGHGPIGAEMYFQTSTQWNSPQPMEQIVKIPPPLGSMGTPIGHVGVWAATPSTQPVPANSSSEFNSCFSGQLQTPKQPPSPNVGGITGFTKSQFTYEELEAATGGFCQANLLGQGGFGFVHKGILPDGKEVAIKSLKSGSGQGEREFQAEVEIISRVHHRHLVSLVGYFVADAQRMLVYEFVPNGTLEFHLHGKGRPVMDWATRLKIALGSAKGLGYLHEDCHPRIIHRDIKAANILLDYNFEAMVADFGLAKLTSDNNTHVSTRVMGTFGYLAPEYASSGKLTEKSDVFSYGVMLLELITGRRPVDPTGKIMEDSLVDWARPLLSKSMEDGNYGEIVDPRLLGNYDPLEMARMVACAAACIRHSARKRPRMSQIERALDGDASLEDLNDGGKTAHGTPYNNPTGNTETYNTVAYNADMMKFRKMVMSSQEFTSSEYGETSEYGLNPSSSSGDSGEMPHPIPQRKKL
ncbi:proline-rich receptor-like protein kinase PERK1 [Olea europaea var. sylvestris]|uniref:non-specific serine/threonine protein kinase n=1 Tax=Olea europaea subsp. europaea TaxID=158383 RepID=A0A8S0Q4L8_OLEEU|nr:proline-rich receptor-like protein kinase PERK1 [Olea europaea var. sylvestris]CAA2961157.1 proline-rich receptor kinase PERK1 [Olea europaea subsp. europaea]